MVFEGPVKCRFTYFSKCSVVFRWTLDRHRVRGPIALRDRSISVPALILNAFEPVTLPADTHRKQLKRLQCARVLLGCSWNQQQQPEAPAGALQPPCNVCNPTRSSTQAAPLVLQQLQPLHVSSYLLGVHLVVLFPATHTTFQEALLRLSRGRHRPACSTCGWQP